MEAKRFTMIAENCGFRVETPKKQGKQWYIDIQQYTPAGEDWWVSVWFNSKDDIGNAVENLYADFDVDEEAELWIESRGKNGVPDSIKELVEDQEWKEKKLEELHEKLQASPMEESMADRLLKAIESRRFAFERYTGDGMLWNYQPIRVEPVFSSYGQIGWQVYAYDKEFCQYDYELKEITIN